MQEEPMGAIDETRKLVQDFLAPELRELKTDVANIRLTLSTELPTMERRLLDAIRSSEEKISLKIEMLNSEPRCQFRKANCKSRKKFRLSSSECGCPGSRV